MNRTPFQLRAEARELRASAAYAERREDAKAELNAAAKLEAEADFLEGKARPVPPPAAEPEKVTHCQIQPCGKRKRFELPHQARAASAAMFRRTGQQSIAEPCRECGGWHLFYPERKLQQPRR